MSARRGDIEGLRALAVGLVIAYHYGLDQLPGGFIGVDVFFVISGFLITKLLIDEANQTGKISFSNFWARRIRRIVPMSFAVIVVTVIAGLYLLNSEQARQLTTVALGAMGFSANFVLYFTTEAYLSGVALPSPLQHYWSLAIEEQFYLIWPLVLFGALKISPKHWKAILAFFVVVIGLASLTFSIVTTSSNPSAGYYFPHTRIWELLAGAGLALAGANIFRVATLSRAIVGWIGLGSIIWSAVSFNSQTVFPGAAALVPVIATTAVVAAGGAQWGPSKLLSIAPAKRIGAWSYSLYLWHWPVLILTEYRFGTLSGWTKLLLLGATILLSAATYSMIEQPFRRHRWLSARSGRTLVAGTVAIAIGLSSGVVVFATSNQSEAPLNDVASTETPLQVEPTPIDTTQQLPKLERTENAVNALLLGDSTMAALRWFEQGSVGLSGFSYILDAESCRKIADPSCAGREKRTPKTAVQTVADFEGPLDYIVFMGGYDSSVKRFNDELQSFIQEAKANGLKVIFLDFKESLEFPAPGSKGKRSIYAEFNDILREVVAKNQTNDLFLVEWNLFSSGRSNWFRRDGIHLTLEGAVALGWLISHAVANVADNKCPFTDTYPCTIPAALDPGFDLMKIFDVTSTKTKCYEDGLSRERVCTTVDR
jgi:peptidoglycan/LPS O-acetylase OafA/YrhL